MANQAVSAKSRRLAWTLEESLSWLDLNPDSQILQFIALQLAIREGRADEIAQRLRNRANGTFMMGRRAGANAMSIFSGATAVQESLQLDAMSPQTDMSFAMGFGMGMRGFGAGDARMGNIGTAGPGMGGPAQAARRDSAGASGEKTIPVSALTAPSVASHPWSAMLKNKTPAISRLSSFVPNDFLLVESNSIKKLLEALHASSQWYGHFLRQGLKEASDVRTIERIKTQLLLDGEQMELLEQSDINEIAITSSDLYFIDGNDVTVIISGPETTVSSLKEATEKFVARSENPNARCSSFQCLSFDCLAITSDDDKVRAFAANPLPGLHVRSNSRPAFERVLNLIANPQAGDSSLGRTQEFVYIRSLMPWSNEEEDIFIYMSDPFIRRLVGAQVRIAERRRRICYSRLRMIAGAGLLYSSQEGKLPASLEDLVKDECLPSSFIDGRTTCPDGGSYSLTKRGALTVAQCARHGTDAFLTPGIELPPSTVTPEEASEYNRFVNEYNQYWRTYFDPIAVRVQLNEKRYRAQTIVLPLIDNSVYTSLSGAIGGQTEILNQQHLPEAVIFSGAVRVNKELLLLQRWSQLWTNPFQLIAPRQQQQPLDIDGLIQRGLGHQLSFHVCDDDPTFSLDLPAGLGMATLLGSAAPQLLRSNLLQLGLIFLLASVNVPIYAAVDVRDPAVVDRFFRDLESTLRHGSTPINMIGSGDYSKIVLDGGRIAHSFVLAIGPVKFRMFWARIGESVFVASKLRILQDLWELDGKHNDDESSNSRPPAHGIIQLRPKHWHHVLADLRLGMDENCRQICLNNLGSLTVFARALAKLRETGADQPVLPGDILAGLSEYPHLGVGRACTQGGMYSFHTDDASVWCSIHGSPKSPLQPSSHIGAAPDVLPENIATVTAALKFLEDGLHGELIVEKGG